MAWRKKSNPNHREYFWSGTDKIPGFLTQQLLIYQPGASIINIYSTARNQELSVVQFLFLLYIICRYENNNKK